MKKLLLSTTVALSLVTAANADFIGAEVGYAAWNSSLKGDIRNGGSTLDFEQDLGYGSSEINGFMWAYIDHPLPLLPNLKIQKTNFSDSATGNIRSATVYNGTSLAAGSATTSLTLDQVDVIPYWRILDNWVNLDIGLNIKAIDGSIEIKADNTARNDFSVILPMLYAKARFDLPFTGLSVEADASYVGFSGNYVTDIKAGIVYETSYGLGATIGYRQQDMTLEDIDDTYGELNIAGAYAGLFYHF